MNASAFRNTLQAKPAVLQPVQLAWLAAADFVVSAGYGALMPVLPGWLGSLMPGASPPEVAMLALLFARSGWWSVTPGSGKP